MEQGQVQSVAAIYTRDFTYITPNLTTGKNLIVTNLSHNQISFGHSMFHGTLLRFHPLGHCPSLNEQFSRVGSFRGSWSPPDFSFPCFLCRFFWTCSVPEAYFHQVYILSGVGKCKWDVVQESEHLCLSIILGKCFSFLILRAWILNGAGQPWEINPCRHGSLKRRSCWPREGCIGRQSEIPCLISPWIPLKVNLDYLPRA